MLGGAGCVHGYGGVSVHAPVKHTLTGRVHFRTFPTGEGVDNVPVLVLDRDGLPVLAGGELYVPVGRRAAAGRRLRVPAERRRELARERPGKLFSAASAHDHTRFLMNVITLLPDNPNHGQPEEQEPMKPSSCAIDRPVPGPVALSTSPRNRGRAGCRRSDDLQGRHHLDRHRPRRVQRPRRGTEADRGRTGSSSAPAAAPLSAPPSGP